MSYSKIKTSQAHKERLKEFLTGWQQADTTYPGYQEVLDTAPKPATLRVRGLATLRDCRQSKGFSLPIIADLTGVYPEFETGDRPVELIDSTKTVCIIAPILEDPFGTLMQKVVDHLFLWHWENLDRYEMDKGYAFLETGIAAWAGSNADTVELLDRVQNACDILANSHHGPVEVQRRNRIAGFPFLVPIAFAEVEWSDTARRLAIEATRALSNPRIHRFRTGVYGDRSTLADSSGFVNQHGTEIRHSNNPRKRMTAHSMWSVHPLTPDHERPIGWSENKKECRVPRSKIRFWTPEETVEYLGKCSFRLVEKRYNEMFTSIDRAYHRQHENWLAGRRGICDPEFPELYDGLHPPTSPRLIMASTYKEHLASLARRSQTYGPTSEKISAAPTPNPKIRKGRRQPKSKEPLVSRLSELIERLPFVPPLSDETHLNFLSIQRIERKKINRADLQRKVTKSWNNSLAAGIEAEARRLEALEAVHTREKIEKMARKKGNHKKTNDDGGALDAADVMALSSLDKRDKASRKLIKAAKNRERAKNTDKDE